MSYFRRGYNWEQPLYLPAPTGGWNPTSNPWDLAENQASVLDNFLIRPGKIVMRRPFFRRVSLTSVVNPFILGGAVVIDGTTAADNDGMLILSRKTNSTTARCDPWNSPLVRDNVGTKLATGVLTLYQCRLSDGAITSAAIPNADSVIGPRWINFDGLMYGIGYDAQSKSSDVNNNYAMKDVHLMTLPMTQTRGTVGLPTVLTNAPKGIFDLKGFVGRIWLLGGVDVPAGSLTHEATTLYYTIPVVSGGGSASADWRDPTAGTTNKLKMDNDTRDYGVGLAVYSSTLIVFRRSSVWVLRGTTPSAFQLIPISREIGCVDARSIVETDRGVYFMSRRGLMLTDGSTVRNVTGVMQERLVPAVQFEQNVLLSDPSQRGSGWITAAATSSGNIMISIGIHQSSSATETQIPIFSALYDPGNNVWVQISSGLWLDEQFSVTTNLAPVLVSRVASGQLFTIGDGAITQLDNAYTTSAVQSPSFEYAAGRGQVGLYDSAVSGTSGFKIPAEWQTRMVPMTTGSRRKGLLKRVYLDSTFGRAAGSDPGQGWEFSFSTDVNASPIQTTVLPIDNTLGGLFYTVLATPSIERTTADAPMEVTDIVLRVRSIYSISSTILPTDAVAEIYGMGLEFQAGPDIVTGG